MRPGKCKACESGEEKKCTEKGTCLDLQDFYDSAAAAVAAERDRLQDAIDNAIEAYQRGDSPEAMLGCLRAVGTEQIPADELTDGLKGGG